MLPSNKNVTRGIGMVELLARLKDYLRRDLALDLETSRWDGGGQLPLLFRDRYDFHACRLLDEPCLLMVARRDDEATPAGVKKHVDMVAGIAGRETIYVAGAMPAYNRRRLIEHKVAFIVPENQMYLPTLGLDLREHVRGLRKPGSRFFSPSTQAMLLHAIYSGAGFDADVSPLELSKRLAYSKMTLTRVFDELEAAALGEVETRGRERTLRFRMSKRELWARALPRLRSPVKRTVVAPPPSGNIPIPAAGGSALSEYTMLAGPSRAVYAMTVEMWKAFHPAGRGDPRSMPDDDSVAVEIWSYAPLAFGRRGCVDPLSLLLSVGEVDDERVEAAREELLEAVPW